MKSVAYFAFALSVALTACGGGSNGLSPSAPKSVAPLIAVPQSATKALAALPAIGPVEFAYAANGCGNQGCGGGGHIGSISAYSINPTSGALTPLAGSPFTTGSYPNDMAIDPKGKFAYVADSGYYAGVYGHAINPINGALRKVPGSPFAAGEYPYGVAVEPRGKFVYVVNTGLSGGNTTSAYVIDRSSGALKPVAGSPFAAGGAPDAVAVDPNGKFLYESDHGSDDVSAYRINRTSGALTPVAGSPFGPDPYATDLTVDPAGKFVYVAETLGNSGSYVGGVSAYKVDATSGALTKVVGSPFVVGHDLWGLTVHPNGKFLYVSGANDVFALKIKPSGALTRVSGSPFGAGNTPIAVTVDPAGKFAYVANAGDNNISAYSVNATTGALKKVTGSPFASGVYPDSITTCRRVQHSCVPVL